MCPDKPLPDTPVGLPKFFTERLAAEHSAVTFGGAVFRLITSICPEQYMVDLDEAENRGYVRLRHGELRVDYLPDGAFDRAVIVFEHDFDDDTVPCFESNEERDQYLTQIAGALYRHHRARSHPHDHSTS